MSVQYKKGLFYYAAVIIISFCISTSVVSQVPIENVKQEIIRMENNINLYIVRADSTSLSKLVDPGFVATGTEFDNDFINKTIFVSQAKHYTSVVSTFVPISDEKVYLYDNLAVIYFICTDSYKDKNGAHISKLNIMDVWKNSNGRWLLIASKSDKLKE